MILADQDLAFLGARDAAARIARGEITSEDLVRACLARIEAVDSDIQAWAHLDPDYALEQARRADEARRAGQDLGPLHGVPVGIKDIFDTRDMPTENGTPLQAGRQPQRDATVVALARQAGAVILGKTVTTELAVYAPGKTRNPHDPARTPGGSSSGSAAAVASGMVPLAVGSQTNGSMIRPASFCGVVGYKPTHGLISRTGALPQSRVLDTVGVFARDVGDAALLAENLVFHDPADPDTRPRSRPRLVRTCAEPPPVTPALALVKGPVWDRAETDTMDAFAEFAEALGGACEEVELPGVFANGLSAHRTIYCADLALSFAPFYDRGRDQLSSILLEMIEEGRRTLAVDYKQALEWRNVLVAGLDEVFERFDAIITPAAPGQAPKGLDSTGDPVFCTLWTFCGTPAISLPLLTGAEGMPMGVQLVGRRGDDGRLLRTARWLMEWLNASNQES